MKLLTFDSIGKDDVAIAGGKGANLGEMTRAGIPVPDGVVLPACAYDEFIRSNQIDMTAAPQKIREAIQRAVLPMDITEPLLQYYHSIRGDKRVAVRSSATAEDLAEASFAGQQETCLNVIGDEMLLDTVKACYASLWADRAVSYRREQGYAHARVSLAVVVQQMVASEKAGVIFTVNPSGSKEELLINASYGLGEAVVSGLVSPDEYSCARNGAILKTVIGSKETRIVYSDKGTRTEAVPAKMRNKQVLTQEEIELLVQKALEIEKHYGKPMDIEWAFSGGKLYILQARPITVFRENTRPFDFSKLPPVMPLKGRAKKSMLFTLEKVPSLYYPLDYDFSMVIGEQKRKLFLEAGLIFDDGYGLNENGFNVMKAGGFRLTRKILRLLKMLSKLGKHEDNQAAALKKHTDNIARYSALEKLDPMDLQESMKALEAVLQLVAEISYARFRYAVFPGVLLAKKLDRIVKRVDKNLTSYNLLSGLSFKTADMNRDLSLLAQEISGNSALLEDIVSGKSYESIISQYPKARSLFDSFLEKHGCKSDFNCYCLVAKTWKEAPSRFLQVLAPMLSALRASNEKRDISKGEKNYLQILSKMKAAVGEKRYTRLLPQIEFYRFYHYYREETQYMWECAFMLIRSIFDRLAGLLRQDIPEKTDLYYLFQKELGEVCREGSLSAEMKRKIAQRKQNRPVAQEHWQRQKWAVLQGFTKGIRGISGSAGEAIGDVCVIKSPSEFHKLKKGDILVCHYTDPEWTPLFTLAAAVVSDTGGALSHAAIVAREYGIPAVLATGTATAYLKDGDRVAVNGTAGEVVRLGA